MRKVYLLEPGDTAEEGDLYYDGYRWIYIEYSSSFMFRGGYRKAQPSDIIIREIEETTNE